MTLSNGKDDDCHQLIVVKVTEPEDKVTHLSISLHSNLNFPSLLLYYICLIFFIFFLNITMPVCHNRLVYIYPALKDYRMWAVKAVASLP